MNDDLIKAELEKLGYWKEMYKKPNVFGTGQTKFANISYEYIKKDRKETLLELGCGQGRDALFFAKNKINVVATDFAEDAVRFVKETAIKMRLHNIEVKVLDIRQKFDFGIKFDCVYSNLAFQFFDENELFDIFGKVANCLNSDGIFMFSTKKPGDKYYKSGEKISENAYKTKGITRYFFDREHILNLLCEYFDVERVDSESHVNLDNSVSAWWYFIAKRS